MKWAIDMDGIQSVAVIIPAHNEEHFIQSTIASIRAQDYLPQKVTIFVVDNNSSDRTSELAKSAGALVISCPTGRVGAVRNRGVANSQSDILAFIDGDCEAGQYWLSTAIQKLTDAPVGAVGGPCLLPQETTWVERAFVGPPSHREGQTERLAGSSMIVRRKDFELIGGFSETLSAGEDDDFSARIRAIGLTIFTLKNCSVIHNGYPKSLAQIFRKQLWHARNQLEAAESWRDPTLVITHLFTLSVAGGIASEIFAGFHRLLLSSAFFAIALLLAGTLATAKTLRTGGGIKRAMHLTVINVIYLSARSVALVGNYGRKLVGMT